MAVAILAAVAEQRRRRAIDAHDPPFVVHGDDAVVRAVEDRGQQRLLAGERVAQLGGAEGDGELVADEGEEPDPVRRQRGAVRRPERDEPDRPRSLAGLAQVPALVQRHAVPAAPTDPGIRHRPARRSGRGCPRHPDPTTRRARSRTGAGRASPREASHSAPATASLTRTSSPITLAAITPSSPPSATSWLSWYCAKTVSAWRWASSKIRRRSRRRPTAGGSGCAVIGRRSRQHRPHEQEARGRARVLVAARPLAEPEREAAARDERPSSRACPRARGRRRPPERRDDVVAVARSGADRVRRRSQRVVDRLVAHPAPAAPGEAVGRRIERLREPRGVEPGAARHGDPRLHERRAVQRSARPADARHEQLPETPQDLADVARLGRPGRSRAPHRRTRRSCSRRGRRRRGSRRGGPAGRGGARSQALRPPDRRAQVRGREGVGRRGRGSGMPVIAVPGAHARR